MVLHLRYSEKTGRGVPIGPTPAISIQDPILLRTAIMLKRREGRENVRMGRIASCLM